MILPTTLVVAAAATPALSALALLQAGGEAGAWGPLIMLLVGGYASAVVLCISIGGGILASSGLDPDNKTKGFNWIKRGIRGGLFGLMAGAIYQLFVSSF
jgi:hypothetical protein